MSRYKAYAGYKDSEIKWLREIPKHWKLNKFKNIFRIQKRISGEIGHAILSITQRGIKIKDTESGDGQLSMDYSKYQLVYKNDFAMNHMDLLTGFVDISKYDGVTSPDYRVFTLEHQNSNARYFLYLLQLCYIAKIFYPLGQGAANIGRWRLPSDAFNEFVTPTPPFDEQIKIANFLDHETAKIDTLIEKQQQLIKLLKEKRQAVISHAVTKGLNPNAPLRDSCVEWLGAVPAHWDVCLIKFKCREITDGAHVSPVTEGGEHYFVSITDIKKGVINFENALKTSPLSYEYLIKTGCMPFAGDILFSKDGTIGQTAITPDGIDFVVASSLIIIRPNTEKVTSQYLNFLLQSRVVAEQVESFVKGAALRRLSIQNLLKIGGVFPPISEQNKISAYLKQTLAQYDELEAKASELIQFQQERRTALISAAVTGKIDVRDWQPQSQTTNQKIAA